MPALLTTTSRRLCCCSIARNSAVTSWPRETSTVIAVAPTALRDELRRGLLGRLAVDVGDVDVGAFGGEQLRRREPDAGGRAGDERNLVLQPHGAFEDPPTTFGFGSAGRFRSARSTSRAW